MRNEVTRAKAASENKKSFRKLNFSALLCEQNVKRKKSGRRKHKNTAGQVLKPIQKINEKPKSIVPDQQIN